jgi:hypothetical protein
MLVVLRSIEKVDKFQIDRELIIDDTKLAKAFTFREMHFLTSDPVERKNQLANHIK